MKKHAIIPIFIPHKGCPNDCVFCNQKKITARQKPVTPGDVADTIETWLSTLEHRNLDTIEVAFFGGSFTGIPIEEQSAYLTVAKSYKDSGRIDKIHMSTRPDYISKEILDNLKRFDADTIELGVQSFDDEVLRRSGRGHDSDAVRKASELIQDYGFELGIQLMIGLPGDTLERCIYSAKETVKIGPSIARLYPTVILKDTELYRMYLSGEYRALTEKEAVHRTKEMYRILDAAGIHIIRVGLKSSDLLCEDGENSAACGGTYHPAFRQLVESDLAKDALEDILREKGLAVTGHAKNTNEKNCTGRAQTRIKADFFSNGKWFSNMVGHQSCNRKFFLENYPHLNILYKVDNNLQNNQFEVKIKGEKQ